MAGRSCGGGIATTSCLVLVSSWLCWFLLVGHDSTRRLGLARGQRQSPPAGAGAGAGAAAQVGVLLDLRSAGGRASIASISLALEDFYLSQPASPRISLHVVDCKDDEITAASAGTLIIYNNIYPRRAFIFLLVQFFRLILCCTFVRVDEKLSIRRISARGLWGRQDEEGDGKGTHV